MRWAVTVSWVSFVFFVSLVGATEKIALHYCLTPKLLQLQHREVIYRFLGSSPEGTRHKLSLDTSGSFYFTLSPDKRTLHVELVNVRTEFKDQGYSTFLLYEALRKHGAQVEKISGDLELDNAEFYFDAMKSPGMAAEQGVRATPFFKSAAKFGFSRITEAKEYERRLQVGRFGESITRGVHVILERQDIK